MTNDKLPKVTHHGIVDIAGFKIRCYNLDNGERVLSREGFLRALGRTGNPKYKEEVANSEENQLFQTPVFLRANNLTPFISNELITSSQPILFETEGGKKAYGYRANILPLVCYVYVDAEKADVLTPKQKVVAEKCHLLIRGFATVGIIALVDEATGYQYEREKDELQKILKAYIAPELLPWQKRFPDEFYKEIFRLNGWDYTVKGINQRPQVIGRWTNKFVYELLPKGVLQELKNKTPKNEAGDYTKKFHQSLTSDVGNPHLEKQLVAVITLMNISNSWREFIRFFNKKFGQQEIPFTEIEEIEPEDKKENSISFGNAISKIANAGKPKN